MINPVPMSVPQIAVGTHVSFHLASEASPVNDRCDPLTCQSERCIQVCDCAGESSAIQTPVDRESLFYKRLKFRSNEKPSLKLPILVSDFLKAEPDGNDDVRDERGDEAPHEPAALAKVSQILRVAGAARF